MAVILSQRGRILYRETNRWLAGDRTLLAACSPACGWRCAAATVVLALAACGVAATTEAQGGPPSPAKSAAPAVVASAPAAAAASAARTPAWIQVPRTAGRITARELGLVINTADPYSVEVGEFYIQARKLAPEQVLRVELPVKPALTGDEFRAFDRRVSAYFGAGVQALALAWAKPHAVECNSITSALALGFDDELCKQSCAPPLRFSPYLNSASSRPYTDLGLRPAMLLAAADVEGAKAMIHRGVASDFTLGLREAPPVNAFFVSTPDRARNVRAALFPLPGRMGRLGVEVHVEQTAALEGVDRVLLYLTGAVSVAKLDTLGWVPGGVGDHLTSFGGALEGRGGQMPATAWIASGATASYGTVSEPCAHPQKFPHPQVLLLQYVQGSSVIEAYWKSVAWPQQGVFIGEPLAAPFARR
jgi:uncharacterized protein (TIGR03790 family)